MGKEERKMKAYRVCFSNICMRSLLAELFTDELSNALRESILARIHDDFTLTQTV